MTRNIMWRKAGFALVLIFAGFLTLIIGCSDGGNQKGDVGQGAAPGASPAALKTADKLPIGDITGESFIRLLAGTFDPLTQMDTFPLREDYFLKSYGDESGPYLVQLYGPVTSEMKKQITDTGATLHGYIPDFTFLVWMSPDQKKAVEKMDVVRWASIYQPLFRVQPAIIEDQIDDEEDQIQLRVGLFSVNSGTTDAEGVAAQVKSLGGTLLASISHRRLDIEIPKDQIPEVARLSSVKWIERKPVYKLTNDESRWIMDADDVWSSIGLYGAGQVVAIADTGLDRCSCGSCSTSDLHDDFEDGSGNSRVVAVYDSAGDGDCSDNHAHGTHVAGSVAGNGDLSGASPASHNYPSGCFAGSAPEADIVFQATMINSSGSLSVPDLNGLFGEAQGAGASIHSNSWGSSWWNQYTTDAHDADEYMWNNKDFLVLFSASNEGSDSNADGVIDLANIGPPATAKNVVTVGASERNSRTGGYNTWGGSWSRVYPVDPISSDSVSDDMDGMAAFSSRGPVADGRYKPDVVAPGTNIISARSTESGAGTGWGVYDSYYLYMGGTSMSTPLAAGAAALIRDWFTDVESVTPSAALLKAIMANGAIDMSPGQYGTGSYREIPLNADSRNVQGTGRVSVTNSIWPTGELIYGDETSGLTTGESFSKDFSVESASTPLRLTVAWTDCPGTRAAGGGLVNDLDVSLSTPSGTVYPDYANQRGSSSVINYYYGSSSFSRPSNAGRAVRFTPSSYPSILDGTLIYMYDDYYNLPQYIDVNVYDDDGSSGAPGTLLYSETHVPIRQYGGFWYNYRLSSTLTITSGSFYIEIYAGSGSYAAPNLAYSSSYVFNRSWDHNGSSWTQNTSREYGIKAIMRQNDYSTNFDRVNNLLQINISAPAAGAYTLNVDGYNVPGCGGDDQQPFAYAISGEVTEDCTGCLIDDTCYNNGDTNPANVCEVCDVSESTGSWSDNDGQSCDDGLFCNGSDSCQGGSCSPGSSNPCDTDEFCNEVSDTCDPYSICVDIDEECLQVYLLINQGAQIWIGSGDSCTHGIFPAYATVEPGGWLIYLDYDYQGMPPDCSNGDYGLVRGQGSVAAIKKWTGCSESGPESVTAVECAGTKGRGFF